MQQYLSFTLFALLVAVAPGPDTLLTLRNTVIGGRGRGTWTALGICLAGGIQGVLAAAGLGAIIVHAEPVFQTIRWAGVAYLTFLGVMALRAAIRAHAEGWDTVAATGSRRGRWSSLRQGFLCNITNPKVLAFNLAVLPQFVGTHAGLGLLMAYALTLTALGAAVLFLIVGLAARAQQLMRRRRFRRGIEAGTGLVMLGFAGALASEG